jgi:hypothetical protein
MLRRPVDGLYYEMGWDGLDRDFEEHPHIGDK